MYIGRDIEMIPPKSIESDFLLHPIDRMEREKILTESNKIEVGGEKKNASNKTN